MKEKIFSCCLYAAAVFAAVYGTKYLIDALAYMVMNMGSMFRGAADTILWLAHIFAILLFGLLSAYILDPAVVYIAKKTRVGRTGAVVILYLTVVLLLLFLIFKIINTVFIYDKNDISNAFSLLVKDYQNKFSNITQHIHSLSKYDRFGFIPRLQKKLSTDDIDYISVFRRAGSLLADFFLGLILAFYFLKDKIKLLHGTRHIFRLLIPKKIQPHIIYIFRELDNVFSGYIRGQLADAVIISILASCLLSIVHLPFAGIIGIITGFTNIIPYLGALTGLVLSVGAALLDGNFGRAAAAAGIMLILQQIDSLVIAPRLVGERVSLSPPAVIASVGIAGNLFGIWGMVFAVPAAALLKVFLLKMMKLIELKKFANQSDV
ncbi:MAG: AI-2E family transporter [Firmicutes bacterium]|nr:AI-2E family transporter [Bacillota bacterium]